MRLTNLLPNERAIIVDIEGNLSFVKRLNNLGVRKGNEVFILRLSPFNDPLEINVNGILIALRKENASKIIVKVL